MGSKRRARRPWQVRELIEAFIDNWTHRNTTENVLPIAAQLLVLNIVIWGYSPWEAKAFGIAALGGLLVLELWAWRQAKGRKILKTLGGNGERAQGVSAGTDAGAP